MTLRDLKRKSNSTEKGDHGKTGGKEFWKMKLLGALDLCPYVAATRSQKSVNPARRESGRGLLNESAQRKEETNDKK